MGKRDTKQRNISHLGKKEVGCREEQKISYQEEAGNTKPIQTIKNSDSSCEYKIDKEVMIDVSHMSHVYTDEMGNPVHALKDVDVTIYKGEFVAIIGTNGSGKSTLAKHFNVLLTPSEGTVKVLGMDTQDPAHIWDIRQHVGMVFQNPDNQIVAAVVEEDVAFGPENLGIGIWTGKSWH